MQINSVSSLKFYSGGYGSTSFEVQLKEGFLMWVEYDFVPHESFWKEFVLTTEFIEKLVVLLNKIDFLGWEREYVNDILDGHQWSLIITYNGNLKKKVYGSNEYPPTFGKVQRMFNQLKKGPSRGGMEFLD